MATPRLRGGRSVRLGEHAVRRYQQRVRPGLEDDREQVALELARLLELAAVVVPSSERPEWLGDDDLEPDGLTARAPEWVLIGEDIAFPLIQGRLVTCVARGGLSDKARVARRRRRRRRTHIRKGIVQQGGKRSDRRARRKRPMREMADDDGEAMR